MSFGCYISWVFFLPRSLFLLPLIMWNSLGSLGILIWVKRLREDVPYIIISDYSNLQWPSNMPTYYNYSVVEISTFLLIKKLALWDYLCISFFNLFLALKRHSRLILTFLVYGLITFVPSLPSSGFKVCFTWGY